MSFTVLLLAKAAIAAQPRAEMSALVEAVAARLNGAGVSFAFSEQGSPSLRERLGELADAGASRVVILPVMLPMEPGFPAWIRRAVHRWKAARVGFVPEIGIAPAPLAAIEDVAGLLASSVEKAPLEDVAATPTAIPEASIVPPERRRVLLCMGGACNDAAAGGLWQHLRAEQDRLKLRQAGDGMMSCKTSCLGPCNLAPVIQVWPEGTMYCGMDEVALDQVIESHILGGVPVDEYAYAPQPTKQRLR